MVTTMPIVCSRHLGCLALKKEGHTGAASQPIQELPPFLTLAVIAQAVLTSKSPPNERATVCASLD